MSKTFPQGFLWGAATAGHQVEGDNVNSDWWEWEQNPQAPVAGPSGKATDHYHRYREDIAQLAELGFNAFRFSVEWPRVEPRQGAFSATELTHYRDVVQACLDFGVEPVVTLNHMTLPVWAANEGGWRWHGIADRFRAYADVVLNAIGRDVTYVSTINEPELAARLSYVLGMFPPGLVDDDVARAEALDGQMLAHRSVVDLVHNDYPWIKVGLSLACQEYTVEPGAEESADAFRQVWEQGVFDQLGEIDWLGLQTYTRFHFPREAAVNGSSSTVSEESYVSRGLMPPLPPGAKTTAVGYEYRPSAIGAVLREVSKRVSCPLVITENGAATDDDSERVEYVKGALAAVQSAIEDGVNVLGYIHWSYLDNFEWVMGYRARFGLVGFDPVTFDRHVKPSAVLLGKIARAGQL